MKGVSEKLLGVLLLALVVIRVASLGAYPLGDTTEPRYAEIARQMLVTGDWITPQNDPGVPFWAKPPLSFWTQAAAMQLLGVNEFAPRFAATALAALVFLLLWKLARTGEPDRPRGEAWIAVVIAASLPLMISAAGAVMTDMALLVCTTLAMVAFWFVWTAASRRWFYAFFAALGLAMLAKGPIGVVLVMLSIGLFLAIEPGRFTRFFHLAPRLPWFGGLILMGAIFLPWYIAAELRTPGFIDYFIIGEHISRFLLPYWPGDKYGNAHIEPLGMIWLYYAASALTWLPVLVWVAGARLRKNSRLERWTALDRYLLAWAVATPVFFTIARNIIWPYVLPALPALALLIARTCTGRLRLAPASALRWIIPLTALLSAVLFAVVFFYVVPSQSNDRSTRDMLAAMARARVSPNPDARLISIRPPPHSSKFYSRGAIRRLELDEAMALLQKPGEVFLLLEHRDYSPEIKALTEPAPVASNHKYVLVHKP